MAVAQSIVPGVPCAAAGKHRAGARHWATERKVRPRWCSVSCAGGSGIRHFQRRALRVRIAREAADPPRSSDAETSLGREQTPKAGCLRSDLLISESYTTIMTRLGSFVSSPRPQRIGGLVGQQHRLLLGFALFLWALAAPTSWAFHLKPSFPMSVPPTDHTFPPQRPNAQQQFAMAGKGKGDGGGEGKGGFFGGFFSGTSDDTLEKEVKKQAKPDDKGEGSVLKSISRRIFQRRSSEDDGVSDGVGDSKGKKGKGSNRKSGGVVVDMSTFVGPRFPSITPQEEKERVKKARVDLKAKREEQLKIQADARNSAKAEAAQRAKEAAEERKRKAQMQKDANERQKMIMKAAQTKDGAPESPENEKDESDSGVVKSAIGAAQNLVSGVWGSVFNKDNKEEEWIVVCPKTRVSPGEIVPVSAAGLDLLVVVSKDGEKIHAISQTCPHLGTPLDTGMIERRLKPGIELEPGQDETTMDDECFEECIVCPLHNTAFELESGRVRGEWCPYPPVIGKVMGTVKRKTNLPKFDIRTRGKNVEIRLNTSLDRKT